MGASVRIACLVFGFATSLAACAAHDDDRHPGPSHVPAVAASQPPATCGSDLVCPLGFVCAKKAGAFTGDCLRAVDENGAPVYVPHSVDSYGAGPHRCSTASDCPSAFRCDDGRCVR